MRIEILEGDVKDWFLLVGHPCRFITRAWYRILNESNIVGALNDYCESIYRDEPYLDEDDISSIAKKRIVKDFTILHKGHNKEVAKIAYQLHGLGAYEILEENETLTASELTIIKNELECLQKNL